MFLFRLNNNCELAGKVDVKETLSPVGDDVTMETEAKEADLLPGQTFIDSTGHICKSLEEVVFLAILSNKYVVCLYVVTKVKILQKKYYSCNILLGEIPASYWP